MYLEPTTPDNNQILFTFSPFQVITFTTTMIKMIMLTMKRVPGVITINLCDLRWQIMFHSPAGGPPPAHQVVINGMRAIPIVHQGEHILLPPHVTWEHLMTSQRQRQIQGQRQRPRQRQTQRLTQRQTQRQRQPPDRLIPRSSSLPSLGVWRRQCCQRPPSTLPGQG